MRAAIAAAVFLALALVVSLATTSAWVSLDGARGAIGQAHAETLTAASVSKNKVVKITAKEQKAYNRAVRACMDYKRQPNPIVVDMSDLKLTKRQALNVGEMLHANAELFFINTYSDSSYGKKQFTLPCYYSDKQITKMRKRLDAAVAKAKKRIKPGMSNATKVHMLHDYLIDTIHYTDQKKDAYTGLVQRKADCFGYALSMDLLLRRCGFSTDMAFNDKNLDHAWNLVKLGSNWYHVDVTFDTYFTGEKFSSEFNWKKKRCHLYLLQSDQSMRTKDRDSIGTTIQSHNGWTCHHRCTSTLFDSYAVRGAKGTFNQNCKAYKNTVEKFSKDGLRYKVTAYKKVKLVGVRNALKTAKKLTVPATVTYKGVKYSVVGIGYKALSKSNVRTLTVKSSKFTAERVKGSLTKSKVKKIKLDGPAKKKRAAYAKYFKKANSGKSVKVVKA